MTQLSKASVLGIAKETTPGTYVAPTMFIPFSKADYEDVFAEIKDESYRANDTSLQGMYQGVVDATWSIDVMAYPDLVGHFLRGIIGPDTLVAGVSTTSSGTTVAGATSISTVVSIAPNTYVQIDTAANLEYAKVTAVTGTGPFVLTVAGTGTAGGLQFPHASAVAVVATSTHTFKQTLASPAASYSLTVYDTLQTLGFAGAKLSDLQLKIDPKAAVTLSLKYSSFQGTTAGVTAMTPTFTAFAPTLGWQWAMTNAGASSTRGLTYDLNIKRAIDVIHSSDGIQGPREIFTGTLDSDGTYKAIFDSQADLNLYVAYIQSPATAVLQQPLGQQGGGQALTLTMSKSGWYKGKRDLTQAYVQADFSLSGIYNATDGGAVSAVLSNFVSTAY